MGTAARIKVPVDLPEDALAVSRLSRKAAGEEMRRLFCLGLVQEGKLSQGKAADLLGISLAEFLAFMGRHRVSPFVFAEGELDRELDRTS